MLMQDLISMMLLSHVWNERKIKLKIIEEKKTKHTQQMITYK